MTYRADRFIVELLVKLIIFMYNYEKVTKYYKKFY